MASGSRKSAPKFFRFGKQSQDGATAKKNQSIPTNTLANLPPELIKMVGAFLFLSDAANLIKADRDSASILHGRFYAIWRQRFTHFRKMESQFNDSLQGPRGGSDATSTMIATLTSTPRSSRRPPMSPSETELVSVYDDTLQELGLKQAPTSLKDLTTTPALEDFTPALVDSIKNFVDSLVLGQAHPSEAFERYHHVHASELICMIRLFLAVLRISRVFEPTSPSVLQQSLYLDAECASALHSFFSPPLEVSSSDGLQLTREQREFVEHDVKRGELIKVQAYAGTGKTFSLRAYAERRPHNSFLYLTFNKSGQEEADRSFSTSILPYGKPNHKVKAQTTHSLAYRHWGRKAGTTLGDIYPKTAVKLIGSMLPSGKHTSGENAGKKMTDNAVAIYVCRTLKSFFSSNADEVSIEHVPWVLGQQTDLPSVGVLACAKELWAYILQGRDNEGEPVTTPHDAYVKELQLEVSKGNFPDFLAEYDYLLLDEAQDLSDCQCALFLRGAKQSAIIVVGDEHQKLYAFRGATGQPFDNRVFPPSKTFYFTKSFRFGNEVANVASTILSIKANPPWLPRTHKPHLSGSTLFKDQVSSLSMERASQSDIASDGMVEILSGEQAPLGETSGNQKMSVRCHTRLYRTNQRLTIDALHLGKILPPSDRIFLKTNQKMRANDIVSLLRDAHALKFNQTMPSSIQQRLKGPMGDIRTWKELVERVDAEGEGDSDTMLQLVVSLTKVIERTDFLDSVTNLESRFCHDESLATVVMATVHQAKGLEWDNVYMAPDFKPDFFHARVVGSEVRDSWSKDEVCCIYVAMTRAKRHLIISDEVFYWIAAVRGLYRYVLSNETKDCTICNRMDTPIIQRQRRLSKDDFLVQVPEDSTYENDVPPPSSPQTESEFSMDDDLLLLEEEQEILPTTEDLGCVSCLIQASSEKEFIDDDLLDLCICLRKLRPELLTSEDEEAMVRFTGQGSENEDATPAPAQQAQTQSLSKRTNSINNLNNTWFQKSRDRKNVWSMSYSVFKNSVAGWSRV